MTSLLLLQQDLQDYILHGTQSIVNQVVGTEKVSPTVRLGIYGDGYRLRLLEILETDYPGVKFLLCRDSQFEQMGCAYIDTYPSPYRNVRWYGDCLAEFLRTTLPYRNRLILAEMAAFEWSMTLAFDAADHSAASMENVVRIPPQKWPRIVCRPQPAVKRLDLQWNVPTIWKAVDAQTEPEPPHKSDFSIPWLIWRQALKIYFRSLNADEAWAIDAMFAGASFDEICAGLCEWTDEADVALHAAGMLKRWLNDGLVQEISIAAC